MHAEIASREMQFRESRADLRAMFRGRAFRPETFEKGHDRRRASGEPVQRRAVTRRHRQRAYDPARGDMAQQFDEERKVRLVHALLVERQHERAGPAAQQIVGILDAFRDSLAGNERADVELRDERSEFVVGNFRVDGHERENGKERCRLCRPDRPGC